MAIIKYSEMAIIIAHLLLKSSHVLAARHQLRDQSYKVCNLYGYNSNCSPGARDTLQLPATSSWQWETSSRAVPWSGVR